MQRAGMPRVCLSGSSHPSWNTSKLHIRNLVPATFHIIAITFISMSLVQVPWFVIASPACNPHISLGQFFFYGYSGTRYSSADCVNPVIVNLMRSVILMCFMAIIFLLGGFFLDIINPKNSLYRFIRRYALASACTVLWIMAILSISYYVSVSIQAIVLRNSAGDEGLVSYGLGFYLIVASGGVVLVGTFCTLILMQVSESSRIDERCLINRYSGIGNGCLSEAEPFDSPTPPPPYSIPPPPYTP